MILKDVLNDPARSIVVKVRHPAQVRYMLAVISEYFHVKGTFNFATNTFTREDGRTIAFRTKHTEGFDKIYEA